MLDQPSLTPLTWARHGRFMWRRFRCYDFASHMSCVPLAGQELSQAVLSLPIAFQAGPAGWQVVALLGLEDGRNLCLDEAGRWQGRYVPAALRSHPFSVLPGSPETLCIDEASPWVVEDYNAEPLFDAPGQVSAFVASTHDFLKAYEHGRRQLAERAARLYQAGLLVPWQACALTDGHQVYRIDESHWQALDAATWLELRQHDVLPLVYAQLFSQPNLAWLNQRHRAGPALSPAAAHAMRCTDRSALDAWRDAMAAESHNEWDVDLNVPGEGSGVLEVPAEKL